MPDASVRVSVVMSVYNGCEDFIRQAVDSILGQTFTDFEFLIIDDGSVEQTTSLLSRYTDPRIRHVRNEDNQGLARSLNTGCALARGRYIARQDADDLSMPERLSRQVEFLDRHQDIALLGTAFTVINEHGRPLSIVRTGTTDEQLRRRLVTMNCFCHGSVMMRQDVVRQVGAYRELETCQDYDLWLRLAEQARVANLPEPLYRWRLTSAAVSVQKALIQTEHLALVRRLADERRQSGCDSFSPELSAAIRTRTDPTQSLWGFSMKEAATTHLLQSARLFAYGDPLGAVRLGLRGLAADPANPRVWALLLMRPIGTLTHQLWNRSRVL